MAVLPQYECIYTISNKSLNLQNLPHNHLYAVHSFAVYTIDRAATKICLMIPMFLERIEIQERGSSKNNATILFLFLWINGSRAAWEKLLN